MDESVKENTYVRKLHHRITLLTVDSIGHESELHPETVEKRDDLRKRITEDAGPDITQQAPFFKLPAELRNQIYEYLIPANQRVVPIDIFGAKVWSHAEIAISQVCRRIREETIPILYGTNTFALFFRGAWGMSQMGTPWLHGLDPLARSSMTQLSVSVDTCKCKDGSRAVSVAISRIRKIDLATEIGVANYTHRSLRAPINSRRDCRFCERYWLDYTQVRNFSVTIKFENHDAAKKQDEVVSVMGMAACLEWGR
jgi:hypothetical protein